MSDKCIDNIRCVHVTRRLSGTDNYFHGGMVNKSNLARLTQAPAGVSVPVTEIGNNHHVILPCCNTQEPVPRLQAGSVEGQTGTAIRISLVDG